MRVIQDKKIKLTEELLDERFAISEAHDRPADIAYYDGIIAALTQLGFDGKRDENGKHKIFGNYK